VILNARWRGSTPQKGQVYVGRPSKWGNPFTIGRDGTRAQVIERYRQWIASQPKLLADLHELRGKDLICWCTPLPCHADVLAELASQSDRDGHSKELDRINEASHEH